MRKFLAILSLLAFVAAFVGALRSPLFKIRLVELEFNDGASPLEREDIEKTIPIVIGKQSLFDVKFLEIQNQMVQHQISRGWIESVQLKKYFPNTLIIVPKFRVAKAIVKVENNQFRYLSESGDVFGDYRPEDGLDLPVLSGLISSADRQKIDDRFNSKIFLNVLDTWLKSDLGSISTVSEVKWEPEKGLKVLATFPSGQAGMSSNQPKMARTWIILGHDLKSQDWNSQLGRIEKVVRYLGEHGLQARQIWADAGKKIVVKFAYGS